MSEEIIAWIDVETTGLDAQHDLLLEVAVIITDMSLNILHEGVWQAWYPQQVLDAYRSMSTHVVQTMHKKSGLWISSPSAYDIREIDKDIQNQLAAYKDHKIWFGGNSITLDRAFVSAYLPLTNSRLHYQSIDMTSVQKFLTMTIGVPEVEKQNSHEAYEDVHESVRQAQVLRHELKDRTSL